MTYKVGQILYVLSEKNSKAIIPVQVVEQVIHKKITGEDMTYIVTPFNDPSQEVDLSQIVGEIYDDADILRQTMLERTSTMINKLIMGAVNNTKAFKNQPYETGETPSAVTMEEELENIHPIPPTDEPVVYKNVVLPDGTKANISYS